MKCFAIQQLSVTLCRVYSGARIHGMNCLWTQSGSWRTRDSHRPFSKASPEAAHLNEGRPEGQKGNANLTGNTQETNP